MDLPPPVPPQIKTAPTTPAKTKLRLMCSYGGQIVTRPHTKSLCYFGGETRIVSINPKTTTSLSCFLSHLATVLKVKSSFDIKYQLPHLELDSLISVFSDEDLLLMLDEHLRLSSSTSTVPSRIRLFLFGSARNVIDHPKTEAWFVDALNSAEILQRGRECLAAAGFGGEEGVSRGALASGVGGSMAESIVLETSSSFGSSSSSSASLTNLPLIKTHDEDDPTGKLASPETISALASDNNIINPIATSSLNIRPREEPAVLPFSDPAMADSGVNDPSARIQTHNLIGVSLYASSSQSNPLPQQQIQYAQNLSGTLPISSYYPVHQSTQLLPYQPNYLCPVYLVPYNQTQMTNPYSFPMQYGLVDNSTIAPNPAPVQPNTSSILPQVTYRTIFLENPPLNEPSGETQATGAMSKEGLACGIEVDDDPARIQIYKSQPSAPIYSSQFQNNSKATMVPLKEALAQLHKDNIRDNIKQ